MKTQKMTDSLVESVDDTRQWWICIGRDGKAHARFKDTFGIRCAPTLACAVQIAERELQCGGGNAIVIPAIDYPYCASATISRWVDA